jgi:hypothetical protein
LGDASQIPLPLGGQSWISDRVPSEEKGVKRRADLRGGRHKTLGLRFGGLVGTRALECGAAPAEIVLDVDSTDIPLHGEQEDRFFHGYYGQYCYLPLYIVCGEYVLCARLRPSNIDGAQGCVGQPVLAHRRRQLIS